MYQVANTCGTGLRNYKTAHSLKASMIFLCNEAVHFNSIIDICTGRANFWARARYRKLQGREE